MGGDNELFRQADDHFMLNYYAVIVAAGSGSRFGGGHPKQFQLLSGQPILMHSIQTFCAAIESIKIIVVLPEEYIWLWKKLCIEHVFFIPHEIIDGGPERFLSVKRGLSLVNGDGLVAIHDGARPLASGEMIKRLFAMARVRKCVAPAIQPPDSVRLVEGAHSKPIKRSNIRLIQTPQVFDIKTLQRAYQQNFHPSFTDDATVVESIGGVVTLVEGEQTNIKITLPHDLLYAESILNSLNPDP